MKFRPFELRLHNHQAWSEIKYTRVKSGDRRRSGIFSQTKKHHQISTLPRHMEGNCIAEWGWSPTVGLHSRFSTFYLRNIPIYSSSQSSDVVISGAKTGGAVLSHSLPRLASYFIFHGLVRVEYNQDGSNLNMSRSWHDAWKLRISMHEQPS